MNVTTLPIKLIIRNDVEFDSEVVTIFQVIITLSSRNSLLTFTDPASISPSLCHVAYLSPVF